MIELIHLENGLYVKRQLLKAFESYIENNDDVPNPIRFDKFVSKVFEGVVNWASFDRLSEDASLSLINYDTELAEELLDSISTMKVDLVGSWEMVFKITYLEHYGALKIEYDYNETGIILPRPEDYIRSYEQMQKTQLTKIARLLNVLRVSKVG